jgi:hypothetical protein
MRTRGKTIKDYPMTNRTQNILRCAEIAEIDTLKQLAGMYGAEIHRLPNCGMVTVHAIEGMLAKEGMTIKPKNQVSDMVQATGLLKSAVAVLVERAIGFMKKWQRRAGSISSPTTSPSMKR